MNYHVGVPPAPARVRRRPRGVTVLVVIGLLLIAAVLVADRVAAQVASRELRARVAQELDARDVGYATLDVHVGGVPFLTQVATGHYQQITIDVTQVRLPPGTGHGATLPALHVVASGVDADTAALLNGTATAVAEQITGTAVVSFRTLQELLDVSGLGLSGVAFTDDNGALRVDGTVTVAGVSLPVVAVADVSVVDGAMQVRLRDAKAVGVAAPQAVKSYLDGLASRSISARLPELPFGLTLDRLAVAGNGLALTATAHNVPLVR